MAKRKGQKRRKKKAPPPTTRKRKQRLSVANIVFILIGVLMVVSVVLGPILQLSR